MKNLFIEPLKHFIERIMSFLPNLLTSLVLIIAGLIIAWLLKNVVTKISGLLKIDVLSEKIGIVQILHRGGIKEPLSGLVSRLIYWIVLISFIIMGLDALKMLAVESLLERFLLYLPNVIVACIITLLGYLLGNFLGRAALIAAVNAGLSFSGLIGKFIKFTVFLLAASMALELLGIGKNTVLIAFAVVFGGVVLALSIAYGLGGRDAARDHIEKILKQKEDEDEITHI
jgi:hypothetical protein